MQRPSWQRRLSGRARPFAQPRGRLEDASGSSQAPQPGCCCRSKAPAELAAPAGVLSPSPEPGRAGARSPPGRRPQPPAPLLSSQLELLPKPGLPLPSRGGRVRSAEKSSSRAHPGCSCLVNPASAAVAGRARQAAGEGRGRRALSLQGLCSSGIAGSFRAGKQRPGPGLRCWRLTGAPDPTQGLWFSVLPDPVPCGFPGFSRMQSGLAAYKWAGEKRAGPGREEERGQGVPPGWCWNGAELWPGLLPGCQGGGTCAPSNQEGREDGPRQAPGTGRPRAAL